MNFIFKKSFVAMIVAALAVAVVIFAFLKDDKAQAPSPVPQNPVRKVIGTSVEGRKIESFTYGSGGTHITFVGGIHGGYEWNSVLLAYEFKDYLDQNPSIIPANLTITIIPSANPDGVFAAVGKEGRFTSLDVTKDQTTLVAARFNANNVDLNRNFDCKWKSEAVWQNKKVKAGSAPFSEPEAKALKNFVAEINPDIVVFWHSKSNAVYASECEDGILSETLTVMDVYAKAAGYPAVKTFDSYSVTGDAEGWLASIGIPAVTVELKTHDTVEWDKNLLGIKALLNYYASKPN